MNLYRSAFGIRTGGCGGGVGHRDGCPFSFADEFCLALKKDII